MFRHTFATCLSVGVRQQPNRLFWNEMTVTICAVFSQVTGFYYVLQRFCMSNTPLACMTH